MAEETGKALEVTVFEDDVTGTWTFDFLGHQVEVEPRHGFVKLGGVIYEADPVRGLQDVEDLEGEPLAFIHGLIVGRAGHVLQPSPSTGEAPRRIPPKRGKSPVPAKAAEETRPTKSAEPPPDEEEASEAAEEVDETGEAGEEARPRESWEGKPVLTTRQAAEYLELSPKTLETKRTRGGGPPFVKLGRRVVYRREDLDEWLEERVRLSTSDTGER